MERPRPAEDELRSRYNAMAFFSTDYSQAATFALAFAGQDGRLATLPDIIDARLSSPNFAAPWSQYFTTQTAEYTGYSKGGNKIIVVAHGVGPMATPKGTLKAYNSPLKPNTPGRVNNEGRISQEDFLKLVDGHYGEVDIVDYDKVTEIYEYPFIEATTSWMAKEDPLVRARLGVSALEYLARHHDEAEEWARQNGITSTERFKIIHNKDNINMSYTFLDKDEPPIAHLLSISQLMYMNGKSLAFDIACHGKNDGVRMVGIRGKDYIREICPSVHMDFETVSENLPLILRENTEGHAPPQLAHLMQDRNKWFTEYPKDGRSLDTGQPQFVVPDLEKVEGPSVFWTRISGYEMFARYGLDEVQALAPEGANAYVFNGEWKVEGKNHVVPIEFYRIKPDTTLYIPPTDELATDFDLMMRIAG